MKKLLLITLPLFLFSCKASAQIGTVKTEEYQADFEKRQSMAVVSDYTDTIVIPIQVLKIGINEELYEMYPELKDKRVGLGVTNIVIEYLEITNRFVFTEDKLEIKERMVTQFKASKKGVFEEPIDGKGKIKAARYFVYVTVADFAVDEDETVEKGKSKVVVTTFIRLQVRFVDATTGQVYIGSGEGESTKVGESFLKSLDMKFSQSTVGKATRKSLETACTKVVENLIKSGVFKN